MEDENILLIPLYALCVLLYQGVQISPSDASAFFLEENGTNRIFCLESRQLLPIEL
jgi:hypothetical protein